MTGGEAFADIAADIRAVGIFVRKTGAVQPQRCVAGQSAAIQADSVRGCGNIIPFNFAQTAVGEYVNPAGQFNGKIAAKSGSERIVEQTVCQCANLVSPVILPVIESNAGSNRIGNTLPRGQIKIGEHRAFAGFFFSPIAIHVHFQHVEKAESARRTKIATPVQKFPADHAIRIRAGGGNGRFEKATAHLAVLKMKKCTSFLNIRLRCRIAPVRLRAAQNSHINRWRKVELQLQSVDVANAAQPVGGDAPEPEIYPGIAVFVTECKLVNPVAPFAFGHIFSVRTGALIVAGAGVDAQCVIFSPQPFCPQINPKCRLFEIEIAFGEIVQRVIAQRNAAAKIGGFLGFLFCPDSDGALFCFVRYVAGYRFTG